MSGQMVTLESLSRVARRTNEKPPRISVYDVIAATKKCDVHDAGKYFRRMLLTGIVPTCEEVPPQNLIHADGANRNSHGGARKFVVVATAHEMVQILWALPGTNEFRKNCADVVVRYLGGDPNLVEEVFQNREAQEKLFAIESEHPARIFGETVEAIAPLETTATRKRLLDDVRAVVREEIRQTHVWSFSKRSKNHRELMQIGEIVQGEDFKRLDETEHVVRITDFLQDRLDSATWKMHGRKLKNIYAAELKRAKLRESRDEGLPPPVAFNQGEYRIVYTDADTDLMVQTLADCRKRFEDIAGHDEQFSLEPARGQRSIRDYMQKPEASTASGSDVANSAHDE